jgi:antirestriction factor ArdC-like protein
MLQDWVIPLSLLFLPPPLAAAGRGAVIHCTAFTKRKAQDMKTEKSDIYGQITNQIIEAIEAGADNYQMPWHVNGADSALP